LCAANEQLHKDGVGIEHWAGASGVERQQFQAETAQARRDYLIHHATPGELKAEANCQFQSDHAAAVQADAERRQKSVAKLKKVCIHRCLSSMAEVKRWMRNTSIASRPPTTTYSRHW
jgi:hypothetical protein